MTTALLAVIAACSVVMASETIAFAALRLRDRLRARSERKAATEKVTHLAELVTRARAEGRTLEEIQALVDEALGNVPSITEGSAE